MWNNAGGRFRPVGNAGPSDADPGRRNPDRKIHHHHEGGPMNGVCSKCHNKIEMFLPTCPVCGEKLSAEYWEGFVDEVNRIIIDQEGAAP
jgi:RNA polymerase subunit RPABC4/transcription elongation factor Spt4